MKRTVSILIIWLNTVTAFAGNGGVSGGDTYKRSSEKEVVQAVTSIKNYISVVINSLNNDVSVLPNSKLKEVLTKMSNHTDLLEDIRHSKYVPKLNGACFDEENKARDAVTKQIMGSDICFSVSRLRRISSSGLPQELFALALHEHAHHFGFDEKDAVLIQDFFLYQYQEVRRTARLKYRLEDSLSRIESIATEKLLTKIEDGAGANLICAYAGKMSGEGAALFAIGQEIYVQQDEESALIANISLKIDSLVGFCGLTQSGDQVIFNPDEYRATSDRESLKQGIIEVLGYLEKLKLQIKNN